MGAMTRIEWGLSRLAQLADNLGKVPGKTIGSAGIHHADDAVNARLEQMMQKLELYVLCRRKLPTPERALQRAVAAHGGSR